MKTSLVILQKVELSEWLNLSEWMNLKSMMLGEISHDLMSYNSTYITLQMLGMRNRSLVARGWEWRDGLNAKEW